MPLLENKIIAIENLWLSYADKSVLEDINLDIFRGDFLLVSGPNGGGKTSLLRTILGLQKPTQGAIYFFEGGRQVPSLDIGYLPQKNSIDSQFPITVERQSGFSAHRIAAYAAQRKCRRAFSVYAEDTGKRSAHAFCAYISEA